MPADLFDMNRVDTADWPSPSPEPEVRARVRARTRTLRRRRSLPTMGVLVLLLFAVLARPEPGSPVRVAADGGAPSAEEPVPPDHGSTTTSTSTTTTTSRGSRPSTTPLVVNPPPVPPDTPGTRPEDPVTVHAPSPWFPESPAYAEGHPLLEDPEGDARPANAASDPTRDITALDVTANATTVTMELRILDLTWRGQAGESSNRVYRVTVKRPDGYFTFYLDARLADGTFTARGVFWKPTVAVGDDVGAYSTAHDVDGVVGSMNTRTGVVRMTATYEAMNRALASAFTTYEPVRRGSTVVPRGDTELDYVKSPDPNFAYRLGD